MPALYPGGRPPGQRRQGLTTVERALLDEIRAVAPRARAYDGRVKRQLEALEARGLIALDRDKLHYVDGGSRWRLTAKIKESK